MLSAKEYAVGGSTALLDAIGRTIHKIGNAQKHTADDYRAEKVMFIIITDSEENSSREYSADKVKAQIERQKKNYEWEFIFLGKCTDIFEYVPNGVKNGLDFHLTTYLGGLIHGDAGMPTDSRFYIVSGDKGFGSAFHFWEANSNFGGLSFGLLTNEDDFRKAFITEELSWLNIYCLLYVPNLEENLEQASKREDHASKQCDEIIAAFFRQSDKGLLHNEIQRIVGNGDVCKKIYHLVCPVFDRYRVFSAHF